MCMYAYTVCTVCKDLTKPNLLMPTLNHVYVEEPVEEKHTCVRRQLCSLRTCSTNVDKPN